MSFILLSVHWRICFDVTHYYMLCRHAHLVKMFGSNVHSTVEPADRPPVKVETVEYGSVAQRGKELVLLNEWQAVEDALTAIIEGQVQPIAIKGAGGCNPFEGANLWHDSLF